MVKVVTRAEVEKDLNIEFRPYSFSLKWTDQEDTANIVTLCQNRKKILEIGTLYGHTTENIATYNKDSDITTVDITKQLGIAMGLDAQVHELLDESESGIRIRSKNVKKLHISSDNFFESNSEKFDLILVDGDHSKAQVKKDTENALKVLNTGGIIVWHDIYNKDAQCPKCAAEPDFNDVREYLETVPYTVNKIERSWVGYYVHS